MKATIFIQKELVLLFWKRECLRLARMGQKSNSRNYCDD